MALPTDRWKCLYCGNQHLNYIGPCVKCGTKQGEYFPIDPLDETDRDGGQLEDADEAAMQLWAELYDELNGAPENEEDR
jgi:predicted ATP-dependent serine protease